MVVRSSTKRADIAGRVRGLASRGRRLALAGLACLAFGLPAAQASDSAQNFPSQNMRLVLPFAPGSAMDSVSRYLATELGERLGQTVVVENRPGGNGFIAVRAVLSAPADGHTILIGSNSTLWTNAVLFKEMPYDSFKDLAPLTVLFRGDVAILVPNESSHKDMGQLIETARKDPGALRFASGSLGYRLMVENMNRRFELQTTNVPYKSASEVVTAVASGTVDFGVADISAALGLIQSGKVRALAVASEEPSALLPGVPTMDKSGAPGMREHTWVVAALNSATPQPIADKLSTTLVEILQSDETKALYERLGLAMPTLGPDFLKNLQRSEYDELKRTVEFANIELL